MIYLAVHVRLTDFSLKGCVIMNLDCSAEQSQIELHCAVPTSTDVSSGVLAALKQEESEAVKDG